MVWSGSVGDTVNHPGVVTGFGTSNVIGDPRAPLAATCSPAPPAAPTPHTPRTSPDSTRARSTVTSPSAQPPWAARRPARRSSSSAASTGTAITATANTGEVDAPGLQVDPTKSFSISTWVREDQSTDGVVLSQDGAHTSDFMLWSATDSTGTNWRFAMTTSDSPGVWQYDQTNAVINAADRVQLGAWTKLTASYNATTGEMAVYVNGTLAATGLHTSKVAAAANSSLVIGRYFNADARSNPFKGAVADVSVFSFPTTPAGTAAPIVSGVSPTKCIDDFGSNTTDGNSVDVYDCNGTAAQNWSAKDDGTVRILGKCLDAFNNGTANGTKIDLFTCNGGANQQWLPRADGSFLNPVSGRCLDDPGGAVTNNTELQLYDCNGTNPQHWTPTPLS